PGQRAGDPGRPFAFRRPLHPASLWPACARGARDPRAHDSPRGVPVNGGRRLAVALGALGLGLVVVARLSMFVGSAGLSAAAVARALAGRAGPDSVESVVTLQLRLPRVLAAVLAGGGLAVAGVAFQGLTRNPLAEPAVLGVSSGAAF